MIAHVSDSERHVTIPSSRSLERLLIKEEGSYDPERIMKHRELRTQAEGYNTKYAGRFTKKRRELAATGHINF